MITIYITSSDNLILSAKRTLEEAEEALNELGYTKIKHSINEVGLTFDDWKRNKKGFTHYMRISEMELV